MRTAKILTCLMLVFLLIRMYCSDHLLQSDEANNMITIKALIEGEGLRNFFFVHPPLFLLISTLLLYPFGDNYSIVQGISILFSTLSLIPFYFLVRKTSDERTAIVSSLVLAALPMNIYYSTWIKQDAMLLFFFLSSLYLYVNDRTYLSGLLFGIACLTKEFALFLLPITLCWSILMEWDHDKSPKKYLQWAAIGIATSALWYALPATTSFSIISKGFVGSNPFESSWHYPWTFYFRNFPTDITLTLVPFFILGLLALQKKTTLLPALWIVIIYLPFTLAKAKTPWYIYLASPAISMIIAIGILKIWHMQGRTWLKWCIILPAIALTLINIYSFNGDAYFEKLVRKKLQVFHAKEYFGTGRKLLNGSSIVAFTTLNPTLQYFLGISDKRCYVLDSPDDGLPFPLMDREMIARLAATRGIRWFIIDTNPLVYTETPQYSGQNISDLSFLFGPPNIIGDLIIFRVSDSHTVSGPRTIKLLRS